MTLDGSGVCLQSCGYTCGPAAAVTALRRIGVPAEEGELAIHAHTTWIAGTQSDALAIAIYQMYGIHSQVIYEDDVKQLQGKIPFITVVKHSFLVDHFVTVLEVTDTQIILGDPLIGERSCSIDEFQDLWRGQAIVFE